MVWECCALGKSGFASETMPRGSPLDNVFNGETKFQILIENVSDKNLSKKERRKRLHMLWNSICQHFANKSVSRASELPYILWGLADEFHTLFNGEEYVCGHWRSNLAESLTWWIPSVKPEHDSYLAPSWSWMSAECPVQLAQLHSNRHRRAVVEIQSVSRAYESRPDNGFGKHAPGSSVSVNGFLRRLRFDYSGPEEDDITLSVVEKDQDGNDRTRHIGRHINLMGDLTFRLTMDHCQKLPSCGLDCYALFTTLQETGDRGRQLSCVLLEHDSVVHNGPYQYHTYKRIGTMDNIGDLYSFKLRYRVAPSVKVPDAGVLRMDSGDTCAEEDVLEDIWTLLSQYLRYVRLDVMSRFKETGIPDTNGYSSLEDDEEEEESEWGEDSFPSQRQSVTRINDNEDETGIRPVSPQALTESRILPDDMDAAIGEGHIQDAVAKDRHRQRLRDIVLCIHDHPFSGLANITGTKNEAEAADRLRQVSSFESQTVAYGTNIREDPGEVLYQFDDVLDMWQKTHGVGPWLERLETSVFTIV
ncbi:hypothetical protein FPSE5266_09574 [Fusarium pseudograminearum]|nr:hypothetical protein FPSE5266_09574 [Fusarium pseudograminearum]